MRAYLAFTKKEFYENIRTYKFVILLAVFLLIGILNPLTAKLMPDLMASLMPEGITVNLAEPTAIDSWTQFFKNITQMGMIVLVIIFSGTMANEFSRNTLVNMVTKGLPRHTVILSKFTMMLLIWRTCYFLCFSVTYLYTEFIWGNEGLIHLLLSESLLWTFGVLLLSVLLFGGALTKSSYGSMLMTGGFVIVLFILNLIPGLRGYNPLMLASDNLALVQGTLTISELIPSLICCVLLIVLFIFGSIKVFNKKQI